MIERTFWTKIGLVCILLFFVGCTERQVRIHFEQAEKYRHEGKIDRAIEEYKAILALQPNAFDALNNLGYLYAGKSQFEQALPQYQKALDINPDFAEAHFNIGVAFIHLSKPDSAIAAFKNALQLDPENPETHNNLGAAYTAQDRYEDAFKSYQQALTLKPDYADAYHNLGILYTFQGDDQKAIAQYEKAIRFKPKSPEAHNNLGRTYARIGNYEKALSHFETALRLRPDYALAQNNLQEARTLQQESQKAQKAGAMRAQHILVKTETEARDVLRKLEAGAPFGSLARIHSIDPSGPFGGDVGPFLPGDLLPAFEQAVQKTEPGKIIGPVQSPAGFHIIKRIY